MESGRTSSVGMEIMGFDSKSEIVVSNVAGRKLTWEEIGRRSAKVISFTDLAGHERYLRTTVFGLLSSEPNYCLLMVAANNGLIGMSKEHLGIALALNVPVMVVITKIDICPPQILEQTITQLTKILKSPGARKIPIFIKNKEECINTAVSSVSASPHAILAHRDKDTAVTCRRLPSKESRALQHWASPFPFIHIYPLPENGF
jgi:GTPase